MHGPADATAIPSSLASECFCFSAGLSRLSSTLEQVSRKNWVIAERIIKQSLGIGRW